MIKRLAGATKMMYFPKAASTVFAADSFVTFDGSKNVIPSTSSSTSIVGVCRKAVAATDSDYAAETLIPIEVPTELYVEFLATTASAVATDIGVAVDLTDAVTVNRGASTHHVVTITQVISATQVAVVINALASTVAGA
jgi:hypothetical protein